MSEEMKQNMPFLEVKNLVVEYFTKEQVIHAVNGVSFILEKGKNIRNCR